MLIIELPPLNLGPSGPQCIKVAEIIAAFFDLNIGALPIVLCGSLQGQRHTGAILPHLIVVYQFLLLPPNKFHRMSGSGGEGGRGGERRGGQVNHSYYSLLLVAVLCKKE